MSHTPGPWIAERQLKADGTPTAYGWDIIAEVTPAPGTDSTTLFVAEASTKANARLIAAAPDLLEALQWSLRHLQQAKQHAYDDRSAVPIALAINACHIAIAKATGGAQ